MLRLKTKHKLDWPQVNFENTIIAKKLWLVFVSRNNMLDKPVTFIISKAKAFFCFNNFQNNNFLQVYNLVAFI